MSMRPAGGTISPGQHRKAVVLALLVTLIWSSSWVIIKFGLESLPPIGFAGLRYGLATVCLLPFVFKKSELASIRRLSFRNWIWLSILGILFYTIAQGGQYIALAHLPAVTVSLLLSLTALVVVFLGIIFLAESPGRTQWLGIALFGLGLGIYFLPMAFIRGDWTGLAFALAACLATSLASILGRYINRRKVLSPIAVTVTSMGIGSVIMLLWGGITEGIPSLNCQAWVMVIWMAVVNTAFSFTLWNYTLQTLTAMESSIINNTMLVQIAILAWVFLGETIDMKSGIGLGFVIVGVILVQIRKIRKDKPEG